MRFDLQVIASWIPSRCRVLDLGCGQGHLLAYLKHRKRAIVTGIERDEAKVAACIAKGLTVLQGDINAEVLDYADKEFDYVVLSQTLQQVYDPAQLLAQILRIGCRGIVSFPNFSYWQVRLQLLLTGYAPITRQLPYEWYDTPNIRVITLKDFRRFAKRVGFAIQKEMAVVAPGHNRQGRIIRFWPDWLANYGIYLISREPCEGCGGSKAPGGRPSHCPKPKSL